MPDPTSQDRVIRVFISSTFRDMQAERDILIKKVFPQLRRRCEDRAVTWTEVDLRWGITDEQAAEGQVLPFCLAEIAGCRPFFIGLLGQRYGWVPQSIDADLERQEPWLGAHRQRSVTELEILHGVFKNSDKADRAFFYFRDPAYVNEVEAERRADFVGESPEAAAKLTGLKDRIRQAHVDGQLVHAPRENYRNPEDLGARVLQDFEELIDRLYPPDQVPSTVERERQEHEAYARNRARAFVPRPTYAARLDEYVAGDNSAPLVVLGESGSGKSALLADWAMRYRAAHPQELVLLHFIGGTADSADWAKILRRIMGELKQAFDFTEEIPFDPTEVRQAFPAWLANTAERGRVIIVLDGLNQLEDKDSAPDLVWLPEYWPPNFRLIVSTLPGRVLEAIERRGWRAPVRSLEVGLFTVEERGEAIRRFLALYSKKLRNDLTDRLAAAPQTANPLFLRAVLDELRQFGSHELLEKHLETFLGAADLPSLFEAIMIRWEQDFDGASGDLVGESLSLIWAARNGLSESELLALLGTGGTPLPRLFWTPLFLSAEGGLVNRSGLLTFAHSYLRDAVQDVYVPNEEAQVRYRGRLAKYFAADGVLNDRRLDELPWLLFQVKDWNALRDLLTDIPTFLRLREERRQWELNEYWRTLGRFHDAAKSYGEALDAWLASPGRKTDDASDALTELALFHETRLEQKSAESLYRRGLALDEANYGPDHPRVADALAAYGQFLMTIDPREKAEPFLRRALAIDERTYGTEHADVARDLDNLGGLFFILGRPADAEPLLRRALAIAERVFGMNHPRLGAMLGKLAQLLQKDNRSGEAEPMMRRGLLIEEQHRGPHHPFVAVPLTNLGKLFHRTNRHAEAEPLFRRALANFELGYGPHYPLVLLALANLAWLLRDTNRMEEAESLLRRAVFLGEQGHARDHINMAIILFNLAQFLQDTNRLEEAEPLMRRYLEITLRRFTPVSGEPDQRLQEAIGRYANLLARMVDDHQEILAQLNAITRPYGIGVGG